MLSKKTDVISDVSEKYYVQKTKNPIIFSFLHYPKKKQKSLG